MRSSPGQAASTPPLKKYVTWAYFSVSATWNWRQPRPGDDLGKARHDDRRVGHLDRQARLVLGQRHDGGAGRVGAAVERLKSVVDEGVGQLAGAVGAEVEVDDDVAVADATVHAGDERRPDELVVLAARVGRRERGGRVGRRLRPEAAAVDHRVVPGLRALPALVAVHAVVAPADRRPRRAPGCAPCEPRLEVAG